MDTLTDVLRLLRLRTNVFLHSIFCGAWAVDTSGHKKAAFHVISSGDCWLHMDGHAPTSLQAGDLLVLPRDAPHRLSSLASAPGADVPLNQPAQIKDLAQGPLESTSLICGYFEFNSRTWNPIIQALPEVIVLHGAVEGEEAASVGVMIRLMIEEASADGFGCDVMLDRLGDALFILVVRAVMQRSRVDRGYLAALGDRQLSRAFEAMHNAPELAWTLDALGRAAGMSRSAFATRFNLIVGMTPMHYLTRWRMQLAQNWLSDPVLSMVDIAERSGYASEAAFNRAYKREFGTSPGRDRRQRARAYKPVRDDDA